MSANDLTPALFSKIARYVYETCGINLTEKKKELVNTRLGKVIRARNFSGFREYYEFLVSDETGEAVNELMNAISTNLTFFYRESKHFEFLESTLLPELKAQAKKSGKSHLRIWSAGCSSGAEPYSIAMTVVNSIPDLASWNAKLLATDIDTNMLDTARQGVYPMEPLKGLPPQLLRTYFQHSSERGLYKIKDSIRRWISFRYLNLMEPFPFKGRFDFIFCRNVMIYFDKPTQQALVAKFHSVLKPGGYLFIGHSEGLSGITHDFSYIKPTIYKKNFNT